MDFKNGKVYPHFKEIQRFMENVKDACGRVNFKPDAVMEIDDGGLFDIIASDTFDLDIQTSQIDKHKKLLIVGGITTPRNIKKYFRFNEQIKENHTDDNIVIASMFHKLNIRDLDPQTVVKPHFAYNNLFNDERVVFPWQIWSSMRADYENELQAYSPNYFESAHEIIINRGAPDEVVTRFIPWQNIELLCETTRQYLKETGRKPDAVYGLSRGGHIYAKALSNYLGIPWSAEPGDNMVFVKDIFANDDTAEKIANFEKITTVAMHFRGGKTTMIPEVSLGDALAFRVVSPHERYRNGYHSGMIQTMDDMRIAR